MDSKEKVAEKQAQIKKYQVNITTNTQDIRKLEEQLEQLQEVLFVLQKKNQRLGEFVQAVTYKASKLTTNFPNSKFAQNFGKSMSALNTGNLPQMAVLEVEGKIVDTHRKMQQVMEEIESRKRSIVLCNQYIEDLQYQIQQLLK